MDECPLTNALLEINISLTYGHDIQITMKYKYFDTYYDKLIQKKSKQSI